jgi:LemA protein
MQQTQVQRRSYAGWIALAVGLVVAISMIASYNALVTLDQNVQAQWGQVQNVYQRRADLVPNLVATVKGAANFEKSTYIAVTEARSKVGQISPDVLKNATNDQKALSQYQQAQDNLGSALSRLLVVVENYPQLKANENFLTLQSQLEGTENRIAVERRRYNEAAQAFNTRRNTFPTALYAGLFGSRFNDKAYFQASPAAQNAPQVNFP